MDKYIKVQDIESFLEKYYWDSCSYTDVVNDIICRFSTADVVPITHGYWVEGEKRYEHNWGSITVHQCNCSQCGYTQESSIWGGGISNSIEKTKYCPNCGAKMDLHNKEG